MEEKTHVTISIDAEKAFNKFQHSFVFKRLNKISLEGMYLNTIKGIYEKSTVNIIINEEKLKACQDSVQGNDAYSHHFFSTQCWKS